MTRERLFEYGQKSWDGGGRRGGDPGTWIARRGCTVKGLGPAKTYGAAWGKWLAGLRTGGRNATHLGPPGVPAGAGGTRDGPDTPAFAAGPHPLHAPDVCSCNHSTAYVNAPLPSTPTFTRRTGRPSASRDRTSFEIVGKSVPVRMWSTFRAPLSTSLHLATIVDTTSGEYSNVALWFCFIRSAIFLSCSSMICFITGSLSGKNGTRLIRPRRAGLNAFSRSGRSISASPSLFGAVSGSAHAFMIVSVPTFDVSRMIVFLKFTSIPRESFNTPLSNTW